MRDYGKVSPQFWTGKTGKVLRGNPEAQVVALYLMTSPHANMIGVYHLPMLYLAHETGLTPDAAERGLQACIDAGFCVHDADAEIVFVVEMAAHQVGETLKPNDLRAKSVDRLYRGIGSPEIVSAFHVRYGEAFGLGSPLQAPSKGHMQGLHKPHIPVPVPSTVPVPEKAAREDDPLAGVDPQVAKDFTAMRKALKAPITETAVSGIKREADKLGLSLDSALRICVERNWRGFKAEWMHKDGPAPARVRRDL